MGTAVGAIDDVDLRLYLLAGTAAARVWRTFGSGAGAWSAAAFGALAATSSAARFAVALDPPRFLRTIRRRPEQERGQAAIREPMRAQREHDVVARVLGPRAQAVAG
ncbi:MAG TPA: hypothetical protein VHC45_09985 [Gaiellaceae bacterium]|nr:hypothetical protein [Gaiellaceae bacterium]